MQTPDRESFHELVRRLATIDDNNQAVSPDPLELMNEADRSTSGSINENDQHHTPIAHSEWIRSPATSNEFSAFGTGSLPIAPPVGQYFEPPLGMDFHSVANLDAESVGVVELAPSGDDWQSTKFRAPESASGSGGGQTPAQDGVVTFKTPSPSVRQHE